MRVSVVGTGMMGSRMAANLLRAGHEVTVHNRTRHRTTVLVESGAIWSESPAEAAERSDVIITMLAHPVAVEAAALGDEGFLGSMPEKSLWIDCSTVKPSFSRRMAQEASARTVRALDAPVVGSKGQVERAELTFFSSAGICPILRRADLCWGQWGGRWCALAITGWGAR